MAEQAGVAIGAHPSLPDLLGFGRREIKVTPEEAKNYIIYQIGALQAFTSQKRLQHVKVHGALYNMAAVDEKLAMAIAEGVKEADPTLILVGLAGSVWIRAGQEAGLTVASEIFADRALNPDGTLVSRSQPRAVLHDPEEIAARSLKMITEGRATAITGEEISLKGDTICLHGDTPGAVELARNLKQKLEAAGVTVAPMGSFLRKTS
jgi:UPF0271 protein